MSNPAAPKSLSRLNGFSFDRVLHEDPFTHSIILLGTFPSPTDSTDKIQAIVRIEKTALDSENPAQFFSENGYIQRIELEESTDIYTWLFGWFGDNRERDLKINIICPATDVHVRKVKVAFIVYPLREIEGRSPDQYTKQEQVIVHETPELYEKIVKPYIAAFPASRTQWVENILTGLSERSKILHSSPSFMILPDMKWDLKTISSLYLVSIVQDRTIRSMRDLRKRHVGLLKDIRREAARIVSEIWGLGNGSLRMYVHYQPSYYHFHVHIVNANYQAGMMGMTVGQAHLLDDIISLLELDPDEGPGIYERLTLTYGLGDQHGLFESMKGSYTLT